jgi:hypothetical protein
VTTVAAPAKRPARLDGRLSDDGGYARQRGAGQQSKNDTNETTVLALYSLLGTKAKLHSEEGNVVLTSGPRMRWRGGVEALEKDGCRTGLGAVRAEAGEQHGEEEVDRGGIVLGGSSSGFTTTTDPANGDGNKAAGTRSRLDIGDAHVVRRPPQLPSGEGEGITCFRGSGGLVASRRAAKEQGFGAMRFLA